MRQCQAFLSLVFVLLVPWYAQGQQTVQEREETHAQGIKKVTEIRFGYEDGHRASAGARWSYHEYDERGNHVVTGRYSAVGGAPAGHPMYLRTYDEQNRPVQRTWYCERTDEKPAGRVCLVFQDYEFDRHGNVTEENGYDPEGRFVARVTFRRDAAGHPLERVDHFAADTSKQRRYVYEYNERGDQIAMSMFDSAGELIETTTTRYEYDDRGNITRATSYDSNGKATGSS